MSIKNEIGQIVLKDNLPEIPFNYNWNNKLDCKAFTTLRLHNPNRFRVGQTYRITLKKSFKKHAKIEGVKILLLKNVSDYIAFLDTGYSKEECQNIIKKMYPNKNFEHQKLAFILLKSI